MGEAGGRGPELRLHSVHGSAAAACLLRQTAVVLGLMAAAAAKQAATGTEDRHDRVWSRAVHATAALC